MIAWLWKLIVGNFCPHEWEELERVRKFDSPLAGRPYEIAFIHRCKKCGDIKKTKIN